MNNNSKTPSFEKNYHLHNSFQVGDSFFLGLCWKLTMIIIYWRTLQTDSFLLWLLDFFFSFVSGWGLFIIFSILFVGVSDLRVIVWYAGDYLFLTSDDALFKCIFLIGHATDTLSKEYEFSRGQSLLFIFFSDFNTLSDSTW